MILTSSRPQKRPSLFSTKNSNHSLDWLQVTGYTFSRYKMTTTVTTLKITVSVPGDISDECVTAVMKFLEKSSNSLFAVIERGKHDDHRHLHAAVLLKQPPAQFKTWKSRFYSQKVKPYHPDTIPSKALTAITMYNHEWYDEYLRGQREGKTEVGEIIFDNYDRDAFEAAFPDSETQAALIKKRDRNTLPDPMHVRLYNWFREDFPEQTSVTMESWCVFFNECFLKGRLDYRDQRTRDQLILKSYRYAINDVSLDAQQLKLVRDAGSTAHELFFPEEDSEDMEEEDDVQTSQ